MKAFACSAVNEDSGLAVDAVMRAAEEAGADPALIFMFHGCHHDGAQLRERLCAEYPKAALIGGTSLGGVMDSSGNHGPSSVGMLWIEDAEGDYGAAMRVKTDDPYNAGREALISALQDADCEDEMPDLTWLYQTPGGEEEVLRGLHSVIGDGCPVVGGSAADDTVEGNWSVTGPEGVATDAVVVAVLFPSGEIGFSFQGGYAPTTKAGAATVSPTDGPRVITHIDGQPAAQIYDQWTDHAISGRLESGGNVLAQTTRYPLGVEVGKVDGVDQYLLIHPETVRPDGSMTTFANVEDGTRLVSMIGEVDNLVKRAGTVATQAVAEIEAAQPVGAVIVYCGGCRLLVDDRIDEVQRAVAEAMGNVPFLGTFTFGEQGALQHKNFHGNLMISAVVFGS